MSDGKKVFDQTLEGYRERFKSLSLEHLAESPDMVVGPRCVELMFFNEPLRVSDRGVFTETGKEASFEACVVIYNYLLRYRKGEKNPGAWVAYRDTQHSGPLTVYFADSVEKKIAGAYGKQGAALMDACHFLGGRKPENAPNVDVAMVFQALPDLQLLFLFNHQDEDFPASCSVLFRQGVERFLDPESLAILGAVFAAKLAGRNPA